MKNKTLENIHCFFTVALCVMTLLLVGAVDEQKKTINEYKKITSEAMQVAEDCLRIKQ